jgi:hypothetical protein
MQLRTAIETVARGYEAIPDEDRVMIVHFLRDDNGTWDMSPPMTFPCGQRPSDLQPLLKRLMEISQSDAIITVNDSWTYPTYMQTELHKLSQEEFEAYYDKTPPSQHPERVNCAMYLAATKQGEFMFGFQNRGEELRIGTKEETEHFDGIQVVAVKNIVGIT